ncbi:MAG: sodium:proton antiporter [Candidatus Marinimicrobia bacterium]|nr:sodium:proton antiporter [Candidatus Neomarinimicrobiota bacterium]
MHNPALTIGLAMAVGMAAQVIARHIRIPGIVLLLASGMLFGPDVLNWIQPESLGESLHIIVGFAVAVILFEGGMNLKFSRIKREGRSIQGLITVGALITFVGGTLCAKLFLGWDWRVAILFGTLVIVTGPTVISPLLKRVRVHHSVSVILEAEGILLDAIGAIIAVVALEIAISPSGLSFIFGIWHILTRLLVGTLLGLVGGFTMSFILRFRNLVSDGLENVFILSWVFALFQISNTVSPESGIAAVTFAGMVLGNSKTYIHRELLEFKEQLTVLMIGMLFVILAADVRIAEIQSLGMMGFMTVLALMFIIRPVSVFISTSDSSLNLKQKTLISWIAPRGIVAAAVASFFAFELNNHGYEGSQLRALVFLVIIITVLFAGLTGGLAASALSLKRKSESGWIILGAHGVARLLATIFKRYGQEVICIDENPRACHRAENEGIKVFYGNALEERVLQRAEPDIRKGIIALSGNEEVNYIFSQRAKYLEKNMTILTGIKNRTEGITRKMVIDTGARIPFGRSADMDQWSQWLRQNSATCQNYIYHESKQDHEISDPNMIGILLPLVIRRSKSVEPIDNLYKPKEKDIVYFLLNKQKMDEAHSWLSRHNWHKHII